MKLLSTIDAVDFSEGEKARIVQALGLPESRQRTILESNAPLIRDNDFWRRIQRSLHVTGFRDGNPLAKKLALAKALEGGKATTNRNTWGPLGSLYEKAVRIYVEHKLANLYQLLRTEDFIASAGSQTEQVFRCICRALPMHDASIEDAKELYDLWGFDRTAQMDEILSSVTIRADDVRRMLADGLTTIRREISGAVTTARADLTRHIETQSHEISVLKSSLANLRSITSATNSQIAAIEAKSNQSEFVAKASRSSKRIASSEEKTPAKDSNRALELLESLDGKIENLARQIREQRKRIEALEPSVNRRQQPSPQSQESTTTDQVINRWAPSVELLGVTNRQHQASQILLEVIRRTRAIITDKPEVITGLWNALPNAEIRNLFASPLWLTERDWKTGLEFVSGTTSVPRLLVLSDFDVAIQESYLVPSLMAWLAGQAPSSANRIVLVPSSTDLADVSPRVFEFGTLITQDASYLRDMDKFTGRLKEPLEANLLRKPSSAVVSFDRSRNVTAEQELRRYVAAAGVVLSNLVAERFISVYEGLQALLSPVDAASIAQSAILLPWVRATRGVTVAASVENAFTTLYGN